MEGVRCSCSITPLWAWRTIRTTETLNKLATYVWKSISKRLSMSISSCWSGASLKIHLKWMATARSCITFTAKPEKSMEFVALSDTVLRYLARDDPVLKHVFWDVVSSDGLPQPPSTTTRTACIAIWTPRVNRASIC